jgi:hypothetical protein
MSFRADPYDVIIGTRYKHHGPDGSVTLVGGTLARQAGNSSRNKERQKVCTLTSRLAGLGLVTLPIKYSTVYIARELQGPGQASEAVCPRIRVDHKRLWGRLSAKPRLPCPAFLFLD